MNRLLATGAAAALCVLCGCDSLSGVAAGVRAKLAVRDEPRVRDYPAPPRATYEAVRIAADQMGFRFLRGGPAQGEFDAINGVGQGDVPNSARQISMKVLLYPASDGGTEVSVLLQEIVEADSSNHAGFATETPLRDTPLYDAFFRSVQKAIDTQPAPAR